MEENPLAPKKMNESNVYGVSIRAWIVVILTLTVCVMSGLNVIIEEPLYTAFSLAIGFYFGQKTK